MSILMAAVALACAGLLLLSADLRGVRLRQLLPRAGRSVPSQNGLRTHAPETHGQGAGPQVSAGRGPGGGLGGSAESVEPALPAHLTGPDDPARAITVIDRAAELLRVGLSPAEALAQLADLSDPEVGAVLRRAARSLRLGDDPRTALGRHAAALPAPVAEVLTGMGAVWYVAESAGAPAADMLERFAASRREVADADRERAVSLAGPKATVTVLTWLPAAGLGLALVIGADPLSLLTSALGLLSLAGGGVLLVVGRIWMTAMLRRAQ